MRASIVIPTYRRPNLAFQLVKQIRKFYPKIEIIVVDQESPALQASSLKHQASNLKIKYFNLEKANTSTAKNKGIEEAVGDIIIFFDDDVEITKETIPSHIKVYKNKEIIGVAGRVINDSDNLRSTASVEFKAVETGKTNFLGTKFLYQFWSTKKQEVDFVYGCNMSFRKSLLKKIGGFDESFPKIFEEVDLSKRAKKYGKIEFVPNALVYHHKAESGGIRPEEQESKQKLIFENYGRYLAKNIPFPFSLISLVLRVKTAYGFLSYILLRCFKTLKSNFVFFLLLILAIFLRFWKLQEFFTFNFDEEYQAHLAWEQVKNFHPIWIGVSASNINYYLGPGFTYLNAILFKISKDPAILGYFGSFLGIVTIASIYYLVKNLFSKKAALFAATFYTGSTFLNYFDRRFWNDSPIPFISIWMLYSLMKIKENTRWLILSIFLMGVALHVHLSLLAFWPVILLVVLLNIREIKLKTWFISIAGFFIVTFPLLVFDFVHNFDNMLMPIRYAQKFFSAYHESNFAYSWSQFFNTLSRIWFLRPYTNIQDEIQLGVHGQITQTVPLLSLFSLVVLAWVIYKSIHKTPFRILALSMVSFIAVYLFYPSGVVAYFLLGFIALFSIAVGLFFSRLPNILSMIIMVLFLAVNIFSLVTTQQEQFGLLTRKKLIQDVMSIVGNNSFYLETRTLDGRKYHSAGGWRYLFKAYGRTPAQSHADEFFGWIYPDEISKEKPELRVIISEYPAKLTNKPIKQFQEGVYYGYVFENN